MGKCDSNISSILADKLKSLRKLKKLTLEEVANRSGYTPQAISLSERAQRMPSSKMLIKLAPLYDISETELFKLREKTIIDTVNTYQDSCPINIRNEYEVIIQASNGKFTTPVEPLRGDSLYFENGDYATEEEIKFAKAFILTLRSIKE